MKLIPGVYLLDTNGIDFDASFSCLSKQEQEAVLKKVQEKDRRLAVGKYLLLHKYLEGYSLSTLPNGKPYIEGNPVYVSISHASHYVALMIHDEPCGIDIETNDTERLAFLKKVFLEDEEDYGLTLGMRWNLKEAAYKTVGEGYLKYKDHITSLDDETFTYLDHKFHYRLFELDDATMAIVSYGHVDDLIIVEK